LRVLQRLLLRVDLPTLKTRKFCNKSISYLPPPPRGCNQLGECKWGGELFGGQNDGITWRTAGQIPQMPTISHPSPHVVCLGQVQPSRADFRGGPRWGERPKGANDSPRGFCIKKVPQQAKQIEGPFSEGASSGKQGGPTTRGGANDNGGRAYVGYIGKGKRT